VRAARCVRPFPAIACYRAMVLFPNLNGYLDSQGRPVGTALHSIEDSMLWVTTRVTPTDQLRFRSTKGVRSFEANTPDVTRATGR